MRQAARSHPRVRIDRISRIGALLVVAAIPAMSLSAATTLPKGVTDPWPIVAAALTFSVSVCLDDVEYSIACRERSASEAARRLEQIYVDDYNARRGGGSLTVWFPLALEREEQLRFLRDVEDRAIEAVAAKLQNNVNHLIVPGEAAPGQADQLAPTAARTAQQLRSWHDAVSAEARSGASWTHNWSSRTHRFRPGNAVDLLIHLNMPRQ